MDLQTTTLLTYAGPPLLGAFIGYLTNKVAIRMLFRPLKAWYIAGIRVPMTPGIIPSKRHELAINMGEMVGDHLLTSQDIGAALSTEPFQDHLHHLIDGRVNEVLAKNLGPVASLIPQHFNAYFKVGLTTLKYQVQEGIHNYIQSDIFAETVRGAIHDQLNTLGNKELDFLVNVDDRTAFYATVDEFIARLLTGNQVEEWLASYLQSYFGQAAAQGKTLADILPEEFQDLIVEILEKQAPLVLRHVSVLLAEPSVRDRIIKAICTGVDHFLDTLGPMGAMARGFFDMETLEGKIQDYLADKEDDFSQWLQQEEVQHRVAEALVEQTRKYLATPLYQLLIKLDPQRQNSLCTEASRQILSAMRSQGVGQALSSLLREQFEEMINHGHISLADFSTLMLPGEGRLQLRETVTDELIALLRSHKVQRLLDNMLNEMADKLVEKPIGILQNIMPTGVHKGITDYIVLSANQMLLKEVPGLVDSLNIKSMVTEKVDSLDLLRLERLLLSIMEEQFKYINLFGALLGFLIGLINLIILNV